MALKGDTTNLLLADIFQTLAQNGQLGVLTLRSQEVRRRVLFAKPGVTALDARAWSAERMARLLVAGGLIGREEAERLLASLPERARGSFDAVPFLCAADEAGLVPVETGARLLEIEVREELFEIFTLERMEFEFQEEEVSWEGIPKQCFFRPEEVVLEAARRLDEWQVVREALGDRPDHYVLVGEVPQGVDEQVARAFDGRHTPAEVAERLLLPRFQVLRDAARLVVSGAVRPATADELLRAANELEPGTDSARAVRLLLAARDRLPPGDPRLEEAAEGLVIHRAVEPAVTTLLLRARTLLTEGKPESALALARRAQEVAPNDMGALELLAELHRLRGDRSAEANVRTQLAELAAAAGHYEKSVEFATRVAELDPDATLLDRAFAVYCQKAGLQKHGAEVLSRAAEQRERPARAALLLDQVLLLDPDRPDVRQKLREQRRRRGAQRGALAAAAMALVVLVAGMTGFFGDRVEESAQRARLDLAQRLVEQGVPKLAIGEVQDLLSQDPAGEVREEAEAILRQAREALADLDRRREERLRATVRGRLAPAIEALEAGHFADAASALLSCEEDCAEDAELRRAFDERLRAVRLAVEDRAARARREAAQARVPADAELEATLKHLRPYLGEEVLEDARSLVSLLDGAAEPRIAASERARLDEAARAWLSAVEEGHEVVAEIERRLRRNEALEVISERYLGLRELEQRGEFARAADALERILVEYGDGPLRSTFEKRARQLREAAEALDRAREDVRRGDVAKARERLLRADAELEDVEVVARAGLPVRIETLPPGAKVVADGEEVGATPAVLWVRPGERVGATLMLPGFEALSLDLDADRDRRLAFLQREARRRIALETVFENSAAAAGGRVWLGGRDGVLRRIAVPGGRDAALPTGSLGGLMGRPALDGALVYAATREGRVLVVDAESMEVLHDTELGAEARTGPVAWPGRGALVGTADRRVLLVASDGAVVEMLRAPSLLTTDPVLVKGEVAVGCGDGRVVLSQPDGEPRVHPEEPGPHPVAGLAAAGSRLFVLDEGGTLRLLEARTLEETARRSLGDAAACPLAVTSAGVVAAAGRRALVLAPDSLDTRLEVRVDDWVAALPLLAGGRFYVPCRSAHLHVFDAGDGTETFRQSLSAPAAGPPVLLPEGVLLVTRDGEVLLLGG